MGVRGRTCRELVHNVLGYMYFMLKYVENDIKIFKRKILLWRSQNEDVRQQFWQCLFCSHKLWTCHQGAGISQNYLTVIFPLLQNESNEWVLGMLQHHQKGREKQERWSGDMRLGIYNFFFLTTNIMAPHGADLFRFSILFSGQGRRPKIQLLTRTKYV